MPCTARPACTAAPRPGDIHARWYTTSGGRMAAKRRELVGEHIERVDLQRATGGACVGEVRQRTARQVIDNVDRVAFGDETIDQVRTEEPGATDDHDVHVESAGGR